MIFVRTSLGLCTNASTKLNEISSWLHIYIPDAIALNERSIQYYYYHETHQHCYFLLAYYRQRGTLV
jgi:hypothetical protein